MAVEVGLKAILLVILVSNGDRRGTQPDFELPRSRKMLRTALGPLLLAWLEDPGVSDVWGYL